MIVKYKLVETHLIKVIDVKLQINRIDLFPTSRIKLKIAKFNFEYQFDIKF